MKSNIILVGFMGTGKTTNGRRVAKKIGYEFVDTDLLIEKREQRTIPQIFEQNGEDYFRKLEHNTIRRVHQYKKAVISTGGGTILNPKNLELLKKHGNRLSIGKHNGKSNLPLGERICKASLAHERKLAAHCT